MQYEFSKNISEAVDQSSGFHSIYTYDHFLPYYASNNENDFFECFTLLSAIVAITRKVKLGQVVTCNSYRNTPLLAKNWESVQDGTKKSIDNLGTTFHRL